MITFTSQLFNGQVASTDLVAYQDGDGPWQVVAGNAGVYQLPVTSGRYGLLAACLRASDGASFVTLGYFAVSDGTARFGLNFCTFPQIPTVTISGTVSAVPMGEQVSISDGFSSSLGPAANWTMPALAGAGTLIGMRATNQRPTGMLLQRVNFAQGATFNLDFTGMFFPAESDLTLDPTGGTPFMSTSYYDETGGQHQIDLATAAVTKYRVVPADRVGNGISLLYAQGSSTGTSRSIQRAFKSPVAQTMTLPPAFLLASPPRVAATTPYGIVEITLPRRAGASHYTVEYLGYDSNNKLHIWDLTYSEAWARGTQGANLVSRLPDFSAVPGWKPSFGFPTTGTLSWTTSVVTGPVRLMPGASRYLVQGRSVAAFQDGDETTSSFSSGQLP